MKFLIVSKPRRNPGGRFSTQDESFRELATSLRQSLDSGRLEGAWAIPGGGHALIIEAGSDYEIASEIRTNPLCRDGDNELMPVEDLLGPLKQQMQESGNRPREKALCTLLRNSLFNWNARQSDSAAK